MRAFDLRHLTQLVLAWTAVGLLDIDHVAGRQHGVGALDRLALLRAGRPLRPLHLLEGDGAGLAVAHDLVGAGFAAGLQADLRAGGVDRQDHRQPPLDHIRQRLHLGQLRAPVLGKAFDAADRSAPAAFLVVLDQAVEQRLARHHLKLGIERGAHRQAAAVERLLAVHVDELAPYLFDVVVGREHGRRGVARLDAERLILGLFAFRRGDVAVLDHAVDHPVAPFDGAVGVPERVVVVRPLGQRRQIGGLGERQFVNRLVEISQRRRRRRRRNRGRGRFR